MPHYLPLKVLLLDSSGAIDLTSALKDDTGIELTAVSGVNRMADVINNGPWNIFILNFVPQNRQFAARLIKAVTPAATVILLSDAPISIPPEQKGVLRLEKSVSAPELLATIKGLRRLATHQAETSEPGGSVTARIRELDTLLEIGKAVVTILDVDAILRRVVTEAVSLSNADEGYLLLPDQITGDLYLRAEQNLGESQAHDFQIKVSDSVAGQVVQSGQPMMITNTQNGIKVKTGYTVQALINVPLIFGDTVIGVLGVVLKRVGSTFNQSNLKVIQALADWAAIAITNARLYQEAKRGSKSTELINEISRSILSSLRIEEIPHKLIKTTTDIVGAECGSLALVDEDTQELVFQLSYDSAGEEITAMRGLRMPLGQGIIGYVAARGIPQIVNQVHRNKLWYSEMDELTGFNTEEVLAVPLTTEGKTIGVIELLNKRDSAFDANDRDLLMAVASAAAIAIQNARQYQSLQETHQKLKAAQEQRIASEQWSILGRATASLAHRIHNTTTIVPLAVQDLRDLISQLEIPLSLRQDVTNNMDRIERNVTYTIELADNLLRRFHQKSAVAHDANQSIEQALSLAEIPANVKVQLNLANELPPVDSSSLLSDSIVELISNAVKAMPKGGTVSLRSAFEDNTVKIDVQDSGIGISPERQEKIFSLFYGDTVTGLGFGLWWVRTFLQQYGGEIQVQSEPGHGAKFTLSLPVSRAKPATADSLKRI